MPTGIFTRKEETRKKMRLARLGRKFKGGWKLSEETRKKQSLVNTGKVMSEETKKKISDAKKGHHPSKETVKKMREVCKGEKSYRWKGGITPVNHAIRNSFEYRIWRESVFKRDNWICRFCGQVGGQLQADHIKPFADYPELRFALDNGRTLCKPCHLKTDTWGFRKFNQTRN